MADLRLHVTSPPHTHETPYRLTGHVDGDGAEAAQDGGSVLVLSRVTGLAEEVFLDEQGRFEQPLELEPEADNDLELTVCDAAGRPLARMPFRVRHGANGQVEPVAAPALEPPWPSFALRVKECLHLAADVARATGRDRDELLGHVHAQERYAEAAWAANDALPYQECYDNLSHFAQYLGQLLQDVRGPEARPTRLPEKEAREGLKRFREYLAEVWRQARATGHADLEPALARVAERGQGLRQRLATDTAGVAHELRGLTAEIARVQRELSGHRPLTTDHC